MCSILYYHPISIFNVSTTAGPAADAQETQVMVEVPPTVIAEKAAEAEAAEKAVEAEVPEIRSSEMGNPEVVRQKKRKNTRRFPTARVPNKDWDYWLMFPCYPRSSSYNLQHEFAYPQTN